MKFLQLSSAPDYHAGAAQIKQRQTALALRSLRVFANLFVRLFFSVNAKLSGWLSAMRLAMLIVNNPRRHQVNREWQHGQHMPRLS